jgi:repressor LexA
MELQGIVDMTEEGLQRILDSLAREQCLQRNEHTALGFRLSPTPAQQEVLNKIRELMGLQKGRPPTLEMIGKALNIRAPTVHDHVCKLETRGWIQRNPLESRSILLTDEPVADEASLPYVRIDILGATGAGARLAYQEKEGELVLSRELFTGYDSDDVFSLRVDGTSMSGAGVLDGDFILILRQNTAYRGQIVVAELERDSVPELTVRYWLHYRGQDWLVPRGPDSNAVRFISGEMAIIGVVIGLLRSSFTRLDLTDLSQADIKFLSE